MRRNAFLKTLLLGGLVHAMPVRATPPPALKLLIPANPGGGWDLTGRALGEALVRSGQAASVSYENRGGAAGAIGLAQFANAYGGDPHAMMVMGSVMLGGIITGKPPVGLSKIRPIARLTNEYNVFVLPPRSPFESMRDVLRQFRNDPRSIKWGGGSRGSTEHVAVHMLARSMDIDARRINYVPFRGGGEAAAALMAGYLTVGGSGLSEFLPHISSERMRVVAVTSPERLPGLTAPTLRELGQEVVIGNWRGVCAPIGLAAEQRQALIERVRLALVSPSWNASLAQHRWMSEPLLGEPFEAFVAAEFESMRTVLVKAGLG
ncbi:tripartite tricarboxylate transporter substrate binding protein [Hydrogenophaga sp.]|uniref:Bug family tripartite tricarboxylate transporter substrate binding protein n=1 Tax=Hydrogenophaga sp. TaxID=1904254 RepID=UPI0027203401|nr:tripartite tricarboxylate transporter substrate-binding protein [Hydrogenophaga sp.]MDO8903836.1 tripartite tricarboxylate transporter substrate-binding protein [Hydrogenophaga sp.]